MNNGVRYFKDRDRFLLTGYSYGEFYDWDLYFENIYLTYFGVSDYCFTNLKTFLERQQLNGFVSRTLKEPRQYQHFKPFLAHLALMGSRQTNDFKWLTEIVDGSKEKGRAEDGIMNETTYIDGQSYYNRLKKYIEFWFWYQDFDKNGLPVWNSADHSGMDNQIRRAGFYNAFEIEGVDLASYLFREVKAMEIISMELGYHEELIFYQNKAKRLTDLINNVFWHNEDGFYYDRNEKTGKLNRVKSIAGFIPLWLGIVPDERVERMVNEHLLDTNKFWLSFPVATYSKTEPDYGQNVQTTGECNWRGTTWIPTNYMIFHGLIDYGYSDIAEKIAQKTFEMVYLKNKTTREYYNAETGDGKGLDPFWGWSILAYFVPFEFELKYNPTDLENNKFNELGVNFLYLTFPVIESE